MIATIHPWNVQRFMEYRGRLPGEWHLVLSPKDLTAARVAAIKPRYLFFPHWSWKVPREVFEQTESILFHMTDLPYGRGGSPLQNLIVRGHQETVISAVRMTEELDAGPIYMKRPLDLGGSALEIFERASSIIFEMIEEIVQTNPVPLEQQGTPTYFKRRTPDMSRLPENISSLEQLYDHIRMLDAPGYPQAFLDQKNYRIEFSKTTLKDGQLEAKARISMKDHDGEDE